MLNRREFIQSGLTLSAMSLPAANVLAAGTSKIKALQLERFVFDNRFPESTAVAQAAAAHGVTLAETSGDLLNLWYRDFSLSWKHAPMTLAGLTPRDSLFILETLAADHRMKVVYLGEHGLEDTGSVSHAFAGPNLMIAETATLMASADWQASLGRLMTQCPAGKSESLDLQVRTSSLQKSPRDEVLYSWIIAPRSAVA